MHPPDAQPQQGAVVPLRLNWQDIKLAGSARAEPPSPFLLLRMLRGLSLCLAFLGGARAQPPTPAWGERLQMPFPPSASSIAVGVIVILSVIVLVSVLIYDGRTVYLEAQKKREEERRRGVLAPRRSFIEVLGFGGHGHKH